MRRILVLMLSLAVCGLIASCSQTSTGPEGGGPSSDAYPTKTVSGTLEIPIGSTVTAGDLRVVTFAGRADLDSGGAFEVDVVDSDSYQWLLFVSKTTGDPVMIGLYEPSARAVTADATSTALALTLANPHLAFTSHTDREEYLEAVELSQWFDDILTHLNAAWLSDAETALDYASNPVLYQAVVEACKSTMESLGSVRGGSLDPPYIEDLVGADVAFVNPRHVWYAAGIQDEGGTPIDVVTIARDEWPTYEWGWPGLVAPTPEYTSYPLGDGAFVVCMQRGDDFTMIDQWSDPVGRATCLNAAQAAVHVLDLMIGYWSTTELSEYPDYVSISGTRANQLCVDLRQGKPERFVDRYCELMSADADEFADWFWEGGVPSSAPEEFLEAGAWLFGKTSFVLDLLSLTTDEGPFFWDWAFADENLCYEPTQAAGVVTQLDDFYAPDAEFDVDPPAGVVGTEFTFDASLTLDDQDPLAELAFRWDWNSDGTWDANWNSAQQATHIYGTAGAYTVTMQAKDTDGMIGTITHVLNVGGGAGTATHVKLFRDQLPWYSTATVDVLEALGFTEGVGPDTYEILSSSDMATAPLVPGSDLVIICNDQPQSFYNAYGASQIRFNSFVYQGGALLWEACDQGWNLGSMADAGIVLPGNVGTIFDYDYYNYVTDQNLPLVAGLPDQLDHNYASHESFTNIPDGTTVYCRDESSNPTLVEYSLGGGWVVMSGQPLEHQYDNIYINEDMEELLPRIISYFTGSPLMKSVPGKEPTLSNERPSGPPTDE